jgi:hypothetical protein
MLTTATASDSVPAAVAADEEEEPAGLLCDAEAELELASLWM